MGAGQCKRASGGKRPPLPTRVRAAHVRYLPIDVGAVGNQPCRLHCIALCRRPESFRRILRLCTRTAPLSPCFFGGGRHLLRGHKRPLITQAEEGSKRHVIRLLSLTPPSLPLSLAPEEPLPPSSPLPASAGSPPPDSGPSRPCPRSCSCFRGRTRRRSPPAPPDHAHVSILLCLRDQWPLAGGGLRLRGLRGGGRRLLLHRRLPPLSRRSAADVVTAPSISATAVSSLSSIRLRPRASSSGVWPYLSLAWTSAPALRRSLTTPRWLP